MLSITGRMSRNEREAGEAALIFEFACGPLAIVVQFRVAAEFPVLGCGEFRLELGQGVLLGRSGFRLRFQFGFRLRF